MEAMESTYVTAARLIVIEMKAAKVRLKRRPPTRKVLERKPPDKSLKPRPPEPQAVR